MENVFYLFGVSYIINQIIILYDTIFKSEEAFGDLPDVYSDPGKIKLNKKNISKIPDLILSICNVSWIIGGIAFTEYRPLFIFMLCLTVLFYVVSFSISYIYYSKNKDSLLDMLSSGNGKDAIKKAASEMPKIHSIVITEGLLKIAITSYIIYNHFYL